MRKIRIAPEEYYHIYNRGNNKQSIFIDERDRIRFLFLILHFQSPINFSQIGRNVSLYVKNSVFDNDKTRIEEIDKNRGVELVNFALMPNHFHILMREIKTGGVSKYMERLQKAYTKYFNAKYKKTGHLFQGPFQIVHIKNNDQLLYLSSYIHRNPREIKEWENKEHQYPWSSYQDYIKKNRWEKLLKTDIISGQFLSPEDYKNFVDSSVAKSPITNEENILLELEN